VSDACRLLRLLRLRAPSVARLDPEKKSHGGWAARHDATGSDVGGLACLGRLAATAPSPSAAPTDGMGWDGLGWDGGPLGLGQVRGKFPTMARPSP